MWAPYTSASEESNFRMRFQSSTEEVEELRDELRLLDRELRLKPRALESDDKEASKP
jgi:hypothetical protein